MVEFKIQLEDQYVQKLGEENIEKLLQEMVRQMVLKAAAGEILEEIKTIDLQNDEKWQLSRDLAWEQHSSQYLAGQ